MRDKWTMTAVALLVGVGLVPPVLAQAPPQVETQEPKYACSISAPQNASTTQLAALAKVNLAQAQATANGAVAGTVVGAKLDDENGCVVYSVLINGTDGKLRDVKVDAGTGKVVHQELGGDNEQGEREGDED